MEGVCVGREFEKVWGYKREEGEGEYGLGVWECGSAGV